MERVLLDGKTQLRRIPRAMPASTPNSKPAERARWRDLARSGAIAANLVAPPAAVALGLSGHWVGAATAIAAAHAAWMTPTLWPQCDWYGPVSTDMASARGTATDDVWLTIDDGPCPQDTPVLLDQLEARGAKATFFVIGERAAAHPELLRAIADRGHGIGNHTFTHPQYSFWAYGPRGVAKEIGKTQDTIRQIVGEAPTWFRAPVGFKSPWVQRDVARRGLRLACWNARGLDGVASDPQAVIRRIAAQLHPSATILMHEGRPAADGTRLAPTVLAGVLDALDERGLRTALP